jgi:hypothetical protein
MAISIDECKLPERQNKLRKILSPINSKIVGDKEVRQDSVILYAKGSSPIANHTTFFKTYNDKIKANYFEVWKYNSAKTCELQKLYFRIELKKGFNEYSEILSFHIDLDVVDDSYKKYPHIHVIHPEFRCISDAHIPLNLNDLCDITNSIEKFDANLSKILLAINKEFIMKFKI